MTENQFSTRHTVSRDATTSQQNTSTADRSSEIRELPWSKRLHIVEQLNVSDKKASQVFKCSINTLRNAKQAETVDGEGVDPNQYAALFEPKKRGRKSQKVQQAFDKVPETKVPLEQFCREHDVSINTITQRKRFGRDDIQIAMNPDTKIREIWKQTDQDD